ncbi:MAG: single-stranded-DNA-specific exonuclease RecJ [Romboutsia timonensis]|uniref:single-stranded-DNA-specific exonuclease RecJ n=1 Tax=Romboutsia timonensis TaxID=1776391 RepID=UPI002A74ABFF|nr:single-stranded-DNA-specific exonuclease RecJ [Romboutsia timonensis]MDY3001057.1 single-stranded-DNA-specific exonuclease RecJ [Romboutsia timonensis]
MSNEKWLLRNKKVDLKAMSEKYKISQLLCKLMVNRDIIDENIINSYINPVYKYLHSPKTMKDVVIAVDIIKRKIQENKKIRIIGDYDVDGIISVFILYTALKKCGANVDYEIPDRIKDGYGINENIVKAAYDDGVDTIITCDNGISAIDQIQYAKDLGLTVIVTDHHDVPFIEEDGVRTFLSSQADAIINPKQIECEYKFKSICGAGVDFKLMEALYEEIGMDKEECYKLIEFVAIATVCDVVDLIDENRIFVKNGLEMLNNSKNIGINALKKACGLEDKEITAYHLGFVIGPCLNASGRLDSAKKGLELLLMEDDEEAKNLAQEIVDLNDARKNMTKEGVDRAINIIDSTDINNDKILVVYIPDIHESLAGIVAGRVKEKYNKPTIILTKSEEGVKGSARSIEEYNMFEGLLACKELLDKFGGHPMAAGLSLQEDKVDELRKALNNKCELTDEDLTRKIMIDSSLPLEYLNLHLIEELNVLEPFGKGNSKPVFGVRDAKITKAILLGKDKNVLKLKLLTNNNITIDAMIFNDLENFESKIIEKYGNEELDNLYNKSNNNIPMDFTFYPSINEWNGNKSIQIVVNGIR